MQYHTQPCSPMQPHEHRHPLVLLLLTSRWAQPVRVEAVGSAVGRAEAAGGSGGSGGGGGSGGAEAEEEEEEEEADQRLAAHAHPDDLMHLLAQV